MSNKLLCYIQINSAKHIETEFIMFRALKRDILTCQLRVASCQLIFVSCELLSVSCELQADHCSAGGPQPEQG